MADSPMSPPAAPTNRSPSYSQAPRRSAGAVANLDANSLAWRTLSLAAASPGAEQRAEECGGGSDDDDDASDFFVLEQCESPIALADFTLQSATSPQPSIQREMTPSPRPTRASCGATSAAPQKLETPRQRQRQYDAQLRVRRLARRSPARGEASEGGRAPSPRAGAVRTSPASAGRREVAVDRGPPRPQLTCRGAPCEVFGRRVEKAAAAAAWAKGPGRNPPHRAAAPPPPAPTPRPSQLPPPTTEESIPLELFSQFRSPASWRHPQKRSAWAASAVYHRDPFGHPPQLTSESSSRAAVVVRPGTRPCGEAAKRQAQRCAALAQPRKVAAVTGAASSAAAHRR